MLYAENMANYEIFSYFKWYSSRLGNNMKNSGIMLRENSGYKIIIHYDSNYVKIGTLLKKK